MKAKSCCLLTAFLVTGAVAQGQGTLVFDQQSSTNLPAGGGIIQQVTPPFGQSFTPGLSSIGFIQLGFYDANAGNGVGATLYVNLHSNAINGPIIGQSASVFMPDGFGIGGISAGVTNFLFATPIALTPGVVYYFEPIVQSGDDWGVSVGPYSYPGGSVFASGQPAVASDFWFGEGIIVPEPASVWLLLLGGGLFLFRRHWRRV